MKRLFICMLCLLFFSCDRKDQDIEYDAHITAACGCKHVQKDLRWLRELIKKANTDKTGNYWGAIWLEIYEGKELFVTNMMMGSGGIAYYFFDCSGNHFYAEDRESFESFMLNPKRNVVVYTNMPL